MSQVFTLMSRLLVAGLIVMTACSSEAPTEEPGAHIPEDAGANVTVPGVEGTPEFPPPGPGELSIRGGAVREDAAGDGVAPNGGETPPEVTGMDLTAVKLDIQGGAEVYDFPSSVTDLQITYEATESIPTSLPEGATGVWATDIYLGDTMVHRLTAKLTGSEWTASIAGAEGDTSTPEASPSPATKEPQPEVAGNRLIVHFPVTQMTQELYRPGISFDWISVTELDGTEVDRVPDTGRASFPSVIPTGDDR